ncbi:hypothetical protein GWI33_015624 [Rhynchophorus ferrugineus]|uniref:DRBM domain-containing protein n=1 Tax=Rhynchophorus ferrugineus TaxID=354439 RepID=A0A834I516_RHYFE|nr:hypothetical protein GWI33_015624 [Rhynchophorus ferrugineus]
MAREIGFPEVAGDNQNNHNQVNWKQMYEESRKENNDASNPPRKNQPLSRLWLTPTPSTSEAAKPANFKLPKHPVPKPCRCANKSPKTRSLTSLAPSSEPAPPQTSAWGNGRGRRLANKLANSGLASQHAKIWIPQSQLEELKQSVFQALSAQITAMFMPGPLHNTVSTIALYLGNENYAVDGRSSKNTHRKGKHRPLKIKKSEKLETPVALLNNLALKIGMFVQYAIVTDILEQIEGKTTSPDISEKKSYLKKVNGTVYSNDTLHVRRNDSDTKGTFKVHLNVNDVKFYGEAQTIKNAHNEAAMKALNYINKNKEFSCEAMGNCKEQNQMTKLPISIVYEAAQKRNSAVNFEIVDEFGPAHKKSFTTKCTVGDLEVAGLGKSKKDRCC